MSLRVQNRKTDWYFSFDCDGKLGLASCSCGVLIGMHIDSTTPKDQLLCILHHNLDGISKTGANKLVSKMIEKPHMILSHAKGPSLG